MRWRFERFQEWTIKKHLENQDKFDSGVISMDFEDVEASYYNIMRMSGKIVISKDSQPFQRTLDNRLVSGWNKDGWKQTPGKIMFGNRLNNLLPYRRNKNGDYIVERIIPQPELLESFRDLPVCTGVGVRNWEFLHNYLRRNGWTQWISWFIRNGCCSWIQPDSQWQH